MTGFKLPVYIERAVDELRVGRSYIQGAWQAHVAAERISCAPGCANCCLRPVVITLLEGILLYRHLYETGPWTSALVAKLEASAPLDLSLRPELRMLAARPCPLLTDDKRCAGYEARPTICRLHAVKSLPEHCHPHSILSQKKDKPLDNKKAVEAFVALERRLLLRLGLRVTALPVAAAVLYGARVSTGTLDIGEVDAEAVRDFLIRMHPQHP